MKASGIFLCLYLLGLGAGWHRPEYEAFGYPFDHLNKKGTSDPRRCGMPDRLGR